MTLARSSGSPAAASTPALAASPCASMFWRRLLSFSLVNQPLLASHAASAASSPLSALACWGCRRLDRQPATASQRGRHGLGAVPPGLCPEFLHDTKVVDDGVKPGGALGASQGGTCRPRRRGHDEGSLVAKTSPLPVWKAALAAGSLQSSVMVVAAQPEVGGGRVLLQTLCPQAGALRPRFAEADGTVSCAGSGACGCVSPSRSVLRFEDLPLPSLLRRDSVLPASTAHGGLPEGQETLPGGVSTSLTCVSAQTMR